MEEWCGPLRCSNVSRPTRRDRDIPLSSDDENSGDSGEDDSDDDAGDNDGPGLFAAEETAGFRREDEQSVEVGGGLGLCGGSGGNHNEFNRKGNTIGCNDACIILDGEKINDDVGEGQRNVEKGTFKESNRIGELQCYVDEPFLGSCDVVDNEKASMRDYDEINLENGLANGTAQKEKEVVSIVATSNEPTNEVDHVLPCNELNLDGPGESCRADGVDQFIVGSNKEAGEKQVSPKNSKRRQVPFSCFGSGPITRSKARSGAGGSVVASVVEKGAQMRVVRNCKSHSEDSSAQHASSSMASSNSYSGRRKTSGADSRSTHFSGGSVLCDASIGDSDIQRCNHRVWEDYQHNNAVKLWNFAKNKLGVTGGEDDDVYIEMVKKMEIRYQGVMSQRETNNGSQ